MNKSISIDVYLDPAEFASPKAYKKYVEKKYGLKVTILMEIGPGGGNPYIKFEGQIEKLQEWWTKDYNCCDTLEQALEDCDLKSFDEVLDED